MSPLGPLEKRVLDALWARREGACVRDLRPAFPAIAYTTLMTTLDRLYRKGILDRIKRGRAFYYNPRLNAAELEAALATDALRTALARDVSALRPFLSVFVNVIGDRDHRLLEELEALVRARRMRSPAQAS
jgi:predicted transcriptional regulator